MLDRNDPDHHLVKGIAQENSSALQELYARHGEQILIYLKGMLNDTQLAEEVLQDVMLTVWHKASTFRGECSVRRWLYVIARNQAIDAIRRKQIKIVPYNEEISISTDSPSLQTELKDILVTVFDKLPTQHREVLYLKFFHEMTMAEIADMLEIPLGTVQSRLHAAKARLRGLLQMEGIEHA